MKTTMTLYSRNGFKWSVNEILSLQREFELLGWDVDTIAHKHSRTPNAIMHKLDQEGFADFNVLYSNYHDLNSPIPVDNTNNLYFQDYIDGDDEDDEDDEDNEDAIANNVNDSDYDSDYDNDDDDNDDDDDDSEYLDNDDTSNLSERVYLLEESISEIRDMLKTMMSSITKSFQQKSCYN
jgi:hypothetical protein